MDRLDIAVNSDRLDPAKIVLPGVEVRVVERCGSTNTALIEETTLKAPVLLAAETQTAGRGRRGRRWHSSPGRAITFSLARPIVRSPRELAALSLVAGVAVARGLHAFGVSMAALKWPNDLVAYGAKLGGILVETRSLGRATLAVIGIGINCRRESMLERRLGRSIAFLDDLVLPVPPRNALIQQTALALLEALDAFEVQGLEAVREAWLGLHAYKGKRLRVRLADGRMLTGVASGLAEDGSLQLQTRGGLRAVRSGQVLSARAA
jgi:BirA family biotin operon repressor/biotin-[acetyl-CoA-carboxylase] ligase